MHAFLLLCTRAKLERKKSISSCYIKKNLISTAVKKLQFRTHVGQQAANHMKFMAPITGQTRDNSEPIGIPGTERDT